MSSSTTVDVRLRDRGYPIQIGRGSLADIGVFLSQLRPVSHCVVITDETVNAVHAPRVVEILSEQARTDLVVIAAGEESKAVTILDQVWNQMLSFDADRQTVVVAVGGGVVGDLAGFVAASYGRGIDFFQVPTTLLAQVDSSVGGKVGINLPGAKNMVGAFWQPLGVLIDIETLHTLPARVYSAGLAEVVKYGVIMDAEFFDYLEKHVTEINRRDEEVLQHIVSRCCRLKADVVEEDERETAGRRAILNYGHTFCHAFETVTGYGQLFHGEAVSIGMLCASRLAESMGRVSKEVTTRQYDLLHSLGLPTSVPDADHDKFIEAMQHDKKVENGKLRFVLPSCLGHVELVGDVDDRLVHQSLVDDPAK